MSCSEHSVRAEQHSPTKWPGSTITDKRYLINNFALLTDKESHPTSPTCQGNSPLAASSPPTILLLFMLLPLTPHWQFPVTGGACRIQNMSYIFLKHCLNIFTIVVVVVVAGGLVGRGGGLKHASDKDKLIPGRIRINYCDEIYYGCIFYSYLI